jgi:predicted nucleotidyltransferase
MARSEELELKRKDILLLAKRYGAVKVRVFGSVARGEAGLSSDVDFLVEMEPGRSLFDLGGLLVELEDLLHCKVDILTEKSLHWYIRENVLQEAKPL